MACSICRGEGHNRRTCLRWVSAKKSQDGAFGCLAAAIALPILIFVVGMIGFVLFMGLAVGTLPRRQESVAPTPSSKSTKSQPKSTVKPPPSGRPVYPHL